MIEIKICWKKDKAKIKSIALESAVKLDDDCNIEERNNDNSLSCKIGEKAQAKGCKLE